MLSGTAPSRASAGKRSGKSSPRTEAPPARSACACRPCGTPLRGSVSSVSWSRSIIVTCSKWSDRARAANNPAMLAPITTACCLPDPLCIDCCLSMIVPSIWLWYSYQIMSITNCSSREVHCDEPFCFSFQHIPFNPLFHRHKDTMFKRIQYDLQSFWSLLRRWEAHFFVTRSSAT